MIFWFCRSLDMSLPLIALQYHQVKINLEFKDLTELVVAMGSIDNVSMIIIILHLLMHLLFRMQDFTKITFIWIVMNAQNSHKTIMNI